MPTEVQIATFNEMYRRKNDETGKTEDWTNFEEMVRSRKYHYLYLLEYWDMTKSAFYYTWRPRAVEGLNVKKRGPRLTES